MAKQPKKLGGGPATDDTGVDVVQKYLNALRDYQNVVFAVVVLLLTVGVLSVWQHQRAQEQEDSAWSELANVKGKELDKLKPVVDKYEGTAAHPFLVLAYTSKLYEHGEKADLEQAQNLLTRARDEASNKILSDMIEGQLKGIKRELEDGKLWGAGTAQVGSSSK
jgi:hypothetical protein